MHPAPAQIELNIPKAWNSLGIALAQMQNTKDAIAAFQ
ncbi:MAG: hypothetical protein ACI9R3_001245 [Verrucomicrobiales bacterium]|jgi:hypothetical protein